MFGFCSIQYIRGLKNFEAEQPYQHAIFYLAVLLAEQAWTQDELLAAADGEYIFKTHYNVIFFLFKNKHQIRFY